MSLDIAKLDAIDELARKATPGPWTESGDHPHDRPGTVEVCDLVNDWWIVADGPLNDYHADGAHIAAMDPDTTLALTAALREAWALRDYGRHVGACMVGCFYSPEGDPRPSPICRKALEMWPPSPLGAK